MQRRSPSPAWLLFWFAPLTAEYVSGSAPYLNPFIWLANLLLYGPGVLLIRELRVRWGKGWLAVFILAVAYMIAEEGLLLNTLFDPTKNTSGRLLGVNWVWTTGMLVVHTLVSLLAPLLIAEARFPERAAEPWLSRKAFYQLLVLFIVNVLGLGRLLAPHDRPGIAGFCWQLVIIGGCLWLAKNSPGPEWESRLATAAVRSARWWFFTSLAGMFTTMVAEFVFPALPLPGVIKVALMLTAFLTYLAWFRREGALAPAQKPILRFAAGCGIVSFWILLSPLMSLAKGNPGPVLFGAGTALFLWREHRRRLAAD